MFHGQLGPSFGNWTRAEWYARDIIEDLSHFVNGWSEWTYTVNISVGALHNYSLVTKWTPKCRAAPAWCLTMISMR